MSVKVRLIAVEKEEEPVKIREPPTLYSLQKQLDELKAIVTTEIAERQAVRELERETLTKLNKYLEYWTR